MEYINIDKTIKKAIYIQIAESIRQAIILGRLKDMDQLPTESELCTFFDISDIVVKRAYSLLVEEGLVRRIQGSGTFVTTRETFCFPLRIPKNVEHYEKYNYQSKFIRILLKDLLKTENNSHKILQLPVDTYIHVLKYIVYIEKTPVLLQSVYLPQLYFKEINTSEFMHSSLLFMIINDHGYQIDHAKSSFFPINISSHEAPLLSMMKNDPAHFIKTIIYSNNKPLCYIETIFPGQYTEFEVIL